LVCASLPASGAASTLDTLSDWLVLRAAVCTQMHRRGPSWLMFQALGAASKAGEHWRLDTK